MKKYAALVKDENGNEMFFGETPGECQRWCKEHGVTGENGEYIAEGTFDTESRYFDVEDYADINTNWIW
ncbi:MAG: hypothetical protein IKP95_09480 [Ruminococcus sp.]|nr:hypothetical protein [Ruminococcus sp.]